MRGDGELGFPLLRLYTSSNSYVMTDIFTKALTGVIFEKHRSRSLGERRKASTEVAKDNKCKRRR